MCLLYHRFHDLGLFRVIEKDFDVFLQLRIGGGEFGDVSV